MVPNVHVLIIGARYNDGTVYRSLYTVAKYMLAITYKTLK